MYKLRSSVVFFRISKINLKRVSKLLESARYIENINSISNLVISAKNPKVKYIVYEDGRVMCMGAKSIKDIKSSGQIIVKELKKIEKNVKLLETPRITNLVATYDLGSPVNLNELVKKFMKIEFNPEQFPGAILKVETRNTKKERANKKQKGTILIFNSGKIVLTGFRKFKSIKEAIVKLKRVIKIK